MLISGPCRVVGPNATERFEHAWNQNANVFFIDQPIGVGFSYADYGEKVVSTSSNLVVHLRHHDAPSLGRYLRSCTGRRGVCGNILRALLAIQGPALPPGWRVVWSMSTTIKYIGILLTLSHHRVVTFLCSPQLFMTRMPNSSRQGCRLSISRPS